MKLSKLLALALVLLISVGTIAGSTIAWFTDTVTSANNVITAGDLKAEMAYKDKNADPWKDASEGAIFNYNLWEPGFTQLKHVQLKNAGNLAFKFQLNIIPTVAAAEGETNLADVIEVYVQKDASDAAPTSIADLHSKTPAGTISDLMNDPDGAAHGVLLPAGKTADGIPTETVEMWIALHMKEEAGNEYQGLSVGDGFSVQLLATQYTFEEDSFGNQYDAEATYDEDVWDGTTGAGADLEQDEDKAYVISTAEELAQFAAMVNNGNTFKDKTVKLANNINLGNREWTPIGKPGATTTDFVNSFKGIFDGQGHTISNLNVSNEAFAGLFGLAHNAKIKNVNIDTANITTNRMAGAVVGQLYGDIENCHVKNVEIHVVPNAVEGGYNNGDKVGGVVGWLGDNNNHRTLADCSAKNVVLTAYRDVGGIAGYVAYSTTVENNSVTKATITADQTINSYGIDYPFAGLIWGRNSSSGNVTIYSNNNDWSDENNKVLIIMKDGLILSNNNQCCTKSDLTFYQVPAEYNSEEVVIPEGVTTVGSYAFAHNSNIKTIKLSSTITTLNERAFRDTSASEVILNEGLTNISYQAFRNALNVTSVKIPSTVTTISKEAFQNSGITELVIPSTVTTIEYGGCRDMPELETVTIEGNVDIPVYAFRACANLKTVTIEGNDVTFGGGSRGMIFTNKENGDGSAITVYVANETVKARLLAADTAAKDYGGYTIELLNTSVE